MILSLQPYLVNQQICRVIDFSAGDSVPNPSLNDYFLGFNSLCQEIYLLANIVRFIIYIIIVVILYYFIYYIFNPFQTSYL